jgi:hypothetical protein
MWSARDLSPLFLPNRSPIPEKKLPLLGLQPVLDSQARHAAEIARVACQQPAIVDYRDAGYLKVH